MDNQESYYSLSLLHSLAYDDYVNGNCDGMIDFTVVDSISGADVEKVRHGQWLMPLVDEPWQKGHHGRCSVCGKHYTYNVNKMPKRCDYCDAKMDGGKR